MRRRSLIVSSLVLSAVLAFPVGSSAAAASRGSTKAFCHSFEDLLVYLRTAKNPKKLAKPGGVRVACDAAAAPTTWVTRW